MHWLHMATAGIGLLVGAYGLALVGTVALLAAAWFSPVFKKDFLYAAICVMISTAVFTIGVHDESVRCIAQNEAAVSDAVQAGNSARDEAVAQVKRDMAQEKLRAAPQPPGRKLPWSHAPARGLRNNGDQFNRDPKPGNL